MTPRERAALVVVSGLPAPAGVGGVFVHGEPGPASPAGRARHVDQEGGEVRAFRKLPPDRPGAAYRGTAEALRGRPRDRPPAPPHGVCDVDLAPVLDLPDGPLGSRQFRTPVYGVAFARGLEDAGSLRARSTSPGSARLPVSTDDSPGVRARLPGGRPRAVPRRDPRRRAVRDGLATLSIAGSGPAGHRSTPPRTGCCAGSASAASRSPTRSLRPWSPPSSAGRRGRCARGPTCSCSRTRTTRGVRSTRSFRCPGGELDVHVARVLRFRQRYG